MSSGTIDQCDETSLAVRGLTLYYGRDDVLPRDMSRHHLRGI